MNPDKQSTGSGAGVVILVVCLLLGLPCLVGLVLFGGAFLFVVRDSSPMTMPAPVYTEKAPAIPEMPSLVPTIEPSPNPTLPTDPLTPVPLTPSLPTPPGTVDKLP